MNFSLFVRIQGKKQNESVSDPDPGLKNFVTGSKDTIKALTIDRSFLNYLFQIMKVKNKDVFFLQIGPGSGQIDPDPDLKLPGKVCYLCLLKN